MYSSIHFPCDGDSHVLAGAELSLAHWHCGQLALQRGWHPAAAALPEPADSHKPCPGSGPRFSLSDCQGAGSCGGASDQREQWPKDLVTEGWGRRACPSSLQKLLPFAHLPALAQTVTQAQTTPPGARISATINCRLLFAQPSLHSHLPHLPSLPRTEMFAQLKIPESYRCGRLNHFGALSNPKPGLGSFTFHNTLRRLSEDQGRMCGF